MKSSERGRGFDMEERLERIKDLLLAMNYK